MNRVPLEVFLIRAFSDRATALNTPIPKLSLVLPENFNALYKRVSDGF